MLTGKKLIVTGVAGALGSAAAAKAAAYGAIVIGLDIVPSLKSDAVSNYYQVDLMDAAAVQDIMRTIGPIDGIFNIAGGFQMGMAAVDPDDSQWQAMFAMNVDTMRHATKAAVSTMTAGGAIVNVGAFAALSGVGDMSAYCASKSTVMRLTESLAAELKDSGIRANAVLPTIIDTHQNRKDMPDADFDSWVSPEKLAEVMCFLASEKATAVTGALIPVRGKL